jgi:hypothetical protein
MMQHAAGSRTYGRREVHDKPSFCSKPVAGQSMNCSL